MKLSVVIPAYNEERRVRRTLERMAGYLSTAGYDYELIIVDDGSSDKTAEICSVFLESCGGGKLLRNPANLGKGASVRRGMLAACGDMCLFSDADMSAPIEEVEKLIGEIRRGADIAVGSRGLPDSDIRVHQPAYRETMGKCFNLLVRIMLLGGIMDTQCGFKLFRAECAREIFSRGRLNGFAFDVEALFIARRLGYRIKEVPVIWINSIDSRVNVANAPLRMFLDIFLIKRLWLRGEYKL